MKLDDSSTIISLAAAAAVVVGFTLSRRNMPSDKLKETKQAPPETWESHIPEHHGALQEIWPGSLYIVEATGCSQGPPTRNMILYRTSDRRLVIYNGIAVREDTLQEILALGTPKVLVAPNFMHRCCARVWKDRFPDMLVVAPEAAVEKVAEIVPVDMTTQAWGALPDWNKDVNVIEIDGWKPFETILEFDLGNQKKASVSADLLFTVRYCKDPGMLGHFLFWLFDSYVGEPAEGEMVVPKVSRMARIFGIGNWKKTEAWYRNYAKEHGPSVAVIAVGHGPPVVELNAKDGCTRAYEGVAEQLVKPRW